MEQKKGAKAPERTTKKAVKGERYTCGVCGLAVTVDEPCGCTDCAILCCGEPMKAERSQCA